MDDNNNSIDNNDGGNDLNGDGSNGDGDSDDNDDDGGRCDVGDGRGRGRGPVSAPNFYVSLFVLFAAPEVVIVAERLCVAYLSHIGG